jgi:hypothetical protein
LPPEKKDTIRFRYTEHLKYLDQFDNIQQVKNDYESILKFLNNDNSNETNVFLYKTSKVDMLRKENVFDVFPELKGIR